jgi:alanyl-tRNA synthetase
MEIQFLSSLNFERRKCAKCGGYFWTVQKDRVTCGDTACDGYSFIGKRLTNRRYDHNEIRDLFINFFKEDHTFLKPYPVVPRWREDVLLVNASIYDFQPHVTSGIVKPPANPIVMSQPSIRMLDIDLVGETGRHLTSFEMMCHDSFNSSKNKVYWIDGTVSRSFEFLTKAMGVEPVLITYKENPWSGGGNGGEALEVFVGGLEVATLVFMDMKEDPEGEVEIEGLKYSKMDMQIVDTGYGLERLSWLSYGTSTIYDPLYPEIIRFLLDKCHLEDIDSRLMNRITEIHIIEPGISANDLPARILENAPHLNEKYTKEDLARKAREAKAIYTIADHTRSILFMLADYVIPSNVKVGYLARILIRRTLRNLSIIGGKDLIIPVIEIQRRNFRTILPDVPWDFIVKAVNEEAAKYETALSNGEAVISRYLSKSSIISEKDVAYLYDSHGLDPETIERIAESKGGRAIIPKDFHKLILSMHEKVITKTGKVSIGDFETRMLYYDDTRLMDFTGLVLYSRNGLLVLNQTAFYPEGGGQPCDLGYIEFGPRKIQVSYVERKGHTVIHHVSEDLPEKARVKGHVDASRRRSLMVHHSATHLLLATARAVLGDHVWQAGAQKGVDESRIDITHFSKLTDKEIVEIEQRCLQQITDGRKIIVRNIDWYKALDQYGFRLFQGGVPLDSKLRVVEIQDLDAEGCGGTHLDNISEIGLIKIIRSESIQEGIQRIIFAAGQAALRYVEKIYFASRTVMNQLGTDPDNMEAAFMMERARSVELKKDIDSLRKRYVNSYVEKSELHQGNKVIVRLITGDPDEEETKLLGKIAASNRGEIMLLRTVLGNFAKYIMFNPSGNALELSKSLEPSVSEIQGNKFMATFKSDLDSNKLIRVILDKSTGSVNGKRK